MEVIVIRKKTNKPKLTIAKNQVRIKVGLDVSDNEVQYYKNFTQQILPQVTDSEFTLRGAFSQNKISLSSENKSYKKTFYYESN